MKTLKIFAVLFLSVLLTPEAFSQVRSNFHIGPSFPVGEFGSDDIDDNDASGAGVGITGGLQFTYPLSDIGLGLFGGIDFSYNGLSGEFKEDVYENYELLGVDDDDMELYKYINVPISVGLNYNYTADEKIGVFANAGLVLNFLKVTDFEFIMLNETITSEYELSTNLGYKVGAGIVFNEKFTVAIDYYGLGEHNVDGEIEILNNKEDLDDLEMEIDFVTLTFGIRF